VPLLARGRPIGALTLVYGGPRLAKEVRESLSARRVPSGDRDAFGLTLAIARLIVEAHQGRMWFEEKASGNTFFFTFPVAAK
jgi:K+-sensing histidine kinase KdpD